MVRIFSWTSTPLTAAQAMVADGDGIAKPYRRMTALPKLRDNPGTEKHASQFPGRAASDNGSLQSAVR
jgi:hypothetical protein